MFVRPVGCDRVVCGAVLTGGWGGRTLCGLMSRQGGAGCVGRLGAAHPAFGAWFGWVDGPA